MENYAIFQENRTQLAKTALCVLHNIETAEDSDIMLCARTAEAVDIEKFIEEFHVILKTACNKTYRKSLFSKKTTTQISSMVERGTDCTSKKMPSDGHIIEREIKMNSEKDTNCNTSKARRSMQQTSTRKHLSHGRNIEISQLQLTLGKTLSN